ncbi:MAG: hypothetical protein WB805_10350 [Candidatus Dormiibacterota bacterium]
MGPLVPLFVKSTSQYPIQNPSRVTSALSCTRTAWLRGQSWPPTSAKSACTQYGAGAAGRRLGALPVKS